jgi:hypothetical protein
LGLIPGNTHTHTHAQNSVLACVTQNSFLRLGFVQDKEARQKALKEQLQKQKASISTNEPEAMEQRKLFLDLSKLLAAKVCLQEARNHRSGKGTCFCLVLD